MFLKVKISTQSSDICRQMITFTEDSAQSRGTLGLGVCRSQSGPNRAYWLSHITAQLRLFVFRRQIWFSNERDDCAATKPAHNQ